MKLSLRVLTAGKQEGKLLEIKLPQFLVGRDPQCQLRPASPLISKRHCALIQRDGKAFIRDFGSTNGTFVNDERVTGEVELNNEDQLKIGPIQFAVVLEEDAAAEGRTPLPKALPAAEAKTPTPAPKPTVSAKTPPPATKAPLTTKTPAVAAKAPPADPKVADKSTAAPKPAAEKPAATKPAAAAAKAAGGKPSVSTPTPAPATAPTKSSPAEDQMALDMLMSLDDGGNSDGGGLSASVPEGSTMHEIIIPPEMAAQAGGPGGSKAGPKPTKPQGSGDTRSAAADILAKMTRRPRT